MGRRAAQDRGLLRAPSESLSDGLSTKHSSFRQSQGSGGSSGPFYLRMVFLRSRQSGVLALLHFPPSATHCSYFFSHHIAMLFLDFLNLLILLPGLLSCISFLETYLNIFQV